MPNWKCSMCLMYKNAGKELKRKIGESCFYPKIQRFIQSMGLAIAVTTSDPICKKCYLGVLHSSGTFYDRQDSVEFRRKMARLHNRSKFEKLKT